MAVTKTVEIGAIRCLLETGQIDLGESRVQQLLRRAAMIQEYRSRSLDSAPGRKLPEPHWHMIGHLQRNKVRALLPHVTMIHSLDSLRLAEEISERASLLGVEVEAFLEVNASEEKRKTGLAVGAVYHLAEMIAGLPGLRIIGLMTMAPYTDDTDVIRRTFIRTRELFEEVGGLSTLRPHFRHLSMGMSQDYTIAIEEGATVVRIGSALFEGIASPVAQ